MGYNIKTGKEEKERNILKYENKIDLFYLCIVDSYIDDFFMRKQ